MGLEERRILHLSIEEIRPNPWQPRQVFEEDGLQELASSIARYGILQPLAVRRTGDTWELIAGERRLRAARIAGLKKVPCIETEADDEKSAALALVENLQRRDLHYFEEATAIAEYLQQTQCSREEAAARLGRSPSALANKLRLLKFSPECRRQLTEGGLTERHARSVLRLEDDEERLAAIGHICSRQLNVAQTEQYIERRLSEIQSTPPAGRRAFILKDIRLFLNSVERGLRIMQEAGVEARTERKDTEDAILLTIQISRQRKKMAKNPGVVTRL